MIYFPSLNEETNTPSKPIEVKPALETTVSKAPLAAIEEAVPNAASSRCLNPKPAMKKFEPVLKHKQSTFLPEEPAQPKNLA